MEGGVKRGLVGTVFVRAEETKVTIVCEGLVERLQSFAEWVENNSMLVTSVQFDATCPVVPLSARFPLADAEAYSGGVEGSFAGELAEQIKELSVEIKSKQGKTHSSDEGMI
jgi:acylphosphatase